MWAGSSGRCQCCPPPLHRCCHRPLLLAVPICTASLCFATHIRTTVCRPAHLLPAAEVLPVKSGIGGGDVTKRGGRWESDFIWNKASAGQQKEGLAGSPVDHTVPGVRVRVRHEHGSVLCPLPQTGPSKQLEHRSLPTGW